MNTLKINLSSYKRIFTFGCSFTHYIYPTWPNLLHYENPSAKLYNFGKSGAGNMLICSRLTEADQIFNFDQNDLVAVMQTSCCREDRYVDGWRAHGNVFNNNFYDDTFIRKYADPDGYLLRDLSLIALTQNYLNNLSCDTIHLQGVNLTAESTAMCNDFEKKYLERYEKVLSKFPMSFSDYIAKNGKYIDVFKRGDQENVNDGHPSTYDHYKYLEYLGIKLTCHDYAKECSDRLYRLEKEHHDIVYPEIGSNTFHQEYIT